MTPEFVAGLLAVAAVALLGIGYAVGRHAGHVEGYAKGYAAGKLEGPLGSFAKRLREAGARMNATLPTGAQLSRAIAQANRRAR